MIKITPQTLVKHHSNRTLYFCVNLKHQQTSEWSLHSVSSRIQQVSFLSLEALQYK